MNAAQCDKRYLLAYCFKCWKVTKHSTIETADETHIHRTQPKCCECGATSPDGGLIRRLEPIE